MASLCLYGTMSLRHPHVFTALCLYGTQICLYGNKTHTDPDSGSRLRQEIYGKTSISIEELGNSSLRLTIKNMTNFMSKTGALTRAPVYPASQISPKISKKHGKDF